MSSEGGDVLDESLRSIAAVDEIMMAKAQRRLDNLTKPLGSLGRLEEFARKIAGITGEEMPGPRKKVVFTLVGDHGVAAEGVSAYPQEVTRQMVLNFLGGGAGINVLARHVGVEVAVVDMGVAHDIEGSNGLRVEKVVHGTQNIAQGPAMSRGETLRALETGIGLASEYKERGYNLFGTGEMGIANTTPSSAIAAVLTGRTVAEVTGRGTGIDDDALQGKIRTIERALAVNAPDPSDPIDVLAKVGGAEIAGIAGICIGGAANRVPVVVDGFISTAGALVAYALEPGIKDYLFAAHRSVEQGHRFMLDHMGMRPILELDMRLGEGTGAALAMGLIEAGLKIYLEMATFGEAGVSTAGV